MALAGDCSPTDVRELMQYPFGSEWGLDDWSWKEDDRGHYAKDLLPGFRATSSAHFTQAASCNARCAKQGVDGTITDAEWRELLGAYANSCSYCGVPGRMQIDHVVPISRGGTNTIDNITPACAKCNREKGYKLLEEWCPNSSCSTQ